MSGIKYFTLIQPESPDTIGWRFARGQITAEELDARLDAALALPQYRDSSVLMITRRPRSRERSRLRLWVRARGVHSRLRVGVAALIVLPVLAGLEMIMGVGAFIFAALTVLACLYAYYADILPGGSSSAPRRLSSRRSRYRS
jgi:hypothetical protein